MPDATCKTCPFWAAHEGKPADKGQCHHASLAALENYQATRYADYWCSEHPLRQRDRLAAMAMQGWLSSWPGEHDRQILKTLAEASYAVADAMLAKAGKKAPC